MYIYNQKILHTVKRALKDTSNNKSRSLTTCRDFKVNIYMYKEVSKDYDHWTTTHHHVVSIPTATFDLYPTTTYANKLRLN
jgi:hypothetical protein